jgi:hypothetical protein
MARSSHDLWNNNELLFIVVGDGNLCMFQDYYVGAEVINSQLNHSVLFAKEKDLILTSDYWKIIVNFDLMPYEDVVTTLREDLRELKEASKRSLPIGELRYVETALTDAESKLTDLKEYVPKADKRRGFLDI